MNTTSNPRMRPVAALLPLLAAILSHSAAFAGPETDGAWSRVLDWGSVTVADTFFPESDFGWYDGVPNNLDGNRQLIAIHAAHVPDQSAPTRRVLLWGRNSLCTEGPTGTWLERTRALYFNQDFDPFADATGHGLSQPTNDASDFLLCAGHTYNVKGELVVTGGEVRYTHTAAWSNCIDQRVGCPEGDPDAFQGGIAKLFRFGSSWSSATPMVKQRWYPTPVRLSDGRIYIAAGDTLHPTDGCGRVRQPVSEIYFPEAGFVSRVPNAELMPELTEAYPWVMAAPHGHLFWADPTPKTFNPVTQPGSTTRKRRTWPGRVRRSSTERRASCGLAGS